MYMCMHARVQAAVAHRVVYQESGLCSQQVGYKVNAYDLALFLFSIRLMVLIRC